jgi:2-polyprenyl-3-methyl-5-hydroxy-6-metoxy-1,4-benzoquinol methylase
MMQPQSDYDNWHESMTAAESNQVNALYPWHHTVLKLLPDLNGKTVLEVGCGRGDFARLLGDKYPASKIIATDFSSAAIETARYKSANPLNVRFQVADAQDLPFDDGSFDYVISCECLEHVESPSAMTSNIARCLKAGGGFVITTENYFNGMILAWINSWIGGKPFNSGSGVQPRENFFVFWKVRKLIENAGLRITHMESNHFVWLLLPRFAPNTFFTEDFASSILKRAFRPFGRHFTYVGVEPSQE